VQNVSPSIIDNIFIDVSKNENYTICSLLNGLSDHDAQINMLNNFNTQGQNYETWTIRNFNKYYINNFMIKLSFETWEDIFGGNDVNVIFNNFLNTYLRIFHSSFTARQIQGKLKGTTWIEISSTNKINLYLQGRNTNDKTQRVLQTILQNTEVMKAAKNYTMIE
jgi:hypothetical protein